MPVNLNEPSTAWKLPHTKPLDEAVWQAWVTRGRIREQRSTALRLQAMTWVVVVGLFAAAGAGSLLLSGAIVTRFLVATGAIMVMLQALTLRKYVFASVFAALMLLYNPVAPVFSFSGDWQRGLVAVSAIPFLMSLV